MALKERICDSRERERERERERRINSVVSECSPFIPTIQVRIPQKMKSGTQSICFYLHNKTLRLHRAT